MKKNLIAAVLAIALFFGMAAPANASGFVIVDAGVPKKAGYSWTVTQWAKPTPGVKLVYFQATPGLQYRVGKKWYTRWATESEKVIKGGSGGKTIAWKFSRTCIAGKNILVRPVVRVEAKTARGTVLYPQTIKGHIDNITC